MGGPTKRKPRFDKAFDKARLSSVAVGICLLVAKRFCRVSPSTNAQQNLANTTLRAPSAGTAMQPCSARSDS